MTTNEYLKLKEKLEILEKKIGKKLNIEEWCFAKACVDLNYDKMIIPKSFLQYIDNVKIFSPDVAIYDNPIMKKYIYNNGYACDVPILLGSAQIYGNCIIQGNVIICDNAKIYGNCKIIIDDNNITFKIKDNVEIFGDVEINPSIIRYFSSENFNTYNISKSYGETIVLGGGYKIYDSKSLKSAFFIESLKNGI